MVFWFFCVLRYVSLLSILSSLILTNPCFFCKCNLILSIMFNYMSSITCSKCLLVILWWPMNSFTTVHINCCYCIFVSYFNKTSLWHVEELLPFYGHLISNSFKQVITPSELKARGFGGMLIVSVGKCVCFFFVAAETKKKKKKKPSVCMFCCFLIVWVLWRWVVQMVWWFGLCVSLIVFVCVGGSQGAVEQIAQLYAY